MYEWNSAATLAPLVLGVAGLLAFSFYNAFLSRDPFIRVSLFSNSTARAAYFGAVSHGILVYCLLFYLPLYFESAQDYSPIMSGAAILPYTLTTGAAVITTGLLISKTGKYRVYVRVGWPMTTVGMGLLLVLKKDTPTPAWVSLGIVGGVGLGIVWSAGSFAAQASASASDLPFAAAMFTFLRAVGQTMGVGLGGVIFQNMFKHKIRENPSYAPYATRWAQEAPALIPTINGLDTPEEQGLKDFMITAYVDSFRTVWLVMSVISLVATIINFIWVEDVALDQALATERYIKDGQKRTIKTFRYPENYPDNWI